MLKRLNFFAKPRVEHKWSEKVASCSYSPSKMYISFQGRCVSGFGCSLGVLVLCQQEERCGDGKPSSCQMGWVGDAAVQMVGRKLIYRLLLWGDSKLRMGRFQNRDGLPKVGEESMLWGGEKGELEGEGEA